MNEAKFESAAELIHSFHFLGDDPYCRITPLGNRKVGFSVQSKYPPDIRFLPPKNTRGEDDVVALIHVVYAHPDETNGQFDPHRVPVIISIVPYSRWREKHFDYDFSDDNCPTRESIERSKHTSWPRSLDYDNEFFYDHHTDKFGDKHSKDLEGIDILERVFKEHCDTTRWIQALGIQIRLITRNGVSALFGVMIDRLIRAQKFFGNELDESASLSKSLTGYTENDFKKIRMERLNIFGYKASKRVIIMFCVLTAIAFAVKSLFAVSIPAYIRSIFSNSFLLLTHSILVLWFLDVFLPRLLFRMTNRIIRLRARVILKGRK